MSVTTLENQHMDLIFKSLADATRRDILKRLADEELSISEIAEPYDLEYATISKHLKVLEKAGLIHRRRKGKSFMIKTNTGPIKKIDDWIEYYRKFWNESLDRLEETLAELQQPSKEESKNE